MVPVYAASVTMKVRGVPPCGVTIIVPVRDVESVLAAAAHDIVASAVPDAADVIVSQGESLVADHCSVVLSVFMVNEPVPPAPGALAEDGLTCSTAGSWVIVRTAAAPLDGVAVIVAVRKAAVGFPVAV
jgi:hypothetical protein